MVVILLAVIVVVVVASAGRTCNRSLAFAHVGKVFISTLHYGERLTNAVDHGRQQNPSDKETFLVVAILLVVVVVVVVAAAATRNCNISLDFAHVGKIVHFYTTLW